MHLAIFHGEYPITDSLVLEKVGIPLVKINIFQRLYQKSCVLFETLRKIDFV